jgi:hypothetical protein
MELSNCLVSIAGEARIETYIVALHTGVLRI